MKKGFSLLELFIVIALSGAMAIFALSYINPSSILNESSKAELQSHLSIISAAVFECKEASNMMPTQNGGTYANNTLLSALECNTSIPYPLDGGEGFFLPPAPSGFTNYTATQSGTLFYVSTSTPIDSSGDEILQELNSTYSPKQYILDYNTTTATMRMYLSR